ncbi:MAG: hypothetical protein HF312_17495 [Ignavibacteria bacterium]|jgi:hypothetical protein|nr:hypothetical protein [Ignavibacteria bacterium]MCU7522013.1 hypothetical protein [Ignavibacteria bacterium]
MKEGLLEKIKSRGYWRINFQPLKIDIKFDLLKECKDIVLKNAVNLRGWDYPHVPLRNDENGAILKKNNFVEGFEDFGNHKEFWRMYQSGQFLYYRGLREDWFDEDPWKIRYVKEIKPGKYLGIFMSVIFEITEAYLFLSRLTQSGLYSKGVLLNVSLRNTEKRELWTEYKGMPFVEPRFTGAKDLNFSVQYTKDEVISNPKELAAKLIEQIFDRFGWNPDPGLIKQSQEELLSGKI